MGYVWTQKLPYWVNSKWKGGVWAASQEKKRYTNVASAFNCFIAKLSWYKPYKNTLHIAKINYMKLEIKNILHRNVMYSYSFNSRDFSKPKPSSTTPLERLLCVVDLTGTFSTCAPLWGLSRWHGLSEVLGQDVQDAKLASATANQNAESTFSHGSSIICIQFIQTLN